MVEVLIVIAITALLSSFILTYTSTGRDQITLSVEEAKVAQTILRAKSLTLATYGGDQVPCGYGVNFDYAAKPQTFSLFRYDKKGCADIQYMESQYVTMLSSSTLNDAVRFMDTPDNLEYIFFVPPNPDTYLWQPGLNATTTSGAISLTTRRGDFIRTVDVNSAGQISF